MGHICEDRHMVLDERKRDESWAKVGRGAGGFERLDG